MIQLRLLACTFLLGLVNGDEPLCKYKKTKVSGEKLGSRFDCSSWKDCQRKCQEIEDCVAWNYFKGPSKCLLLSEVAKKKSAEGGRRGILSGPKFCQDESSNSTAEPRIAATSPITSPNYPNEYSNYGYKEWEVEGPQGSTINFKFTDFQIEQNYWCSWDWVRVVDSNGEDLLPQRQRCGYSVPAPFSSKTNKAKVIFSSDYSVTKKGFRLEFDIQASSTGSDCYCGLAQRERRIIGGTETEVNEYPWQVQVRKNGGHWCGGSLVNSEWVLSAAHCFTNPGEYKFRLGEHDIWDTAESDHLELEAAEIINHPNYDPQTTNYDFAMIKLAQPVDFSAHPHIRPVCLPAASSGTFEGKTATVTGWGWMGNQYARYLQEVDVTVLGNTACKNDYGYHSWQITDNMLCASVPQDGQDSCSGDSGGPLVTKSGDGMTPGQNYEKIGVVSWGNGCALANYPGVYARVTDQLDWIKSYIDTSGEFCPRQ